MKTTTMTSMTTMTILTMMALSACGPVGNTLGLDGYYLGDMEKETKGKYSVTENGASGNYDLDTEDKAQVEFQIEPSYTADAIVVGGPCPVELMVEGAKLVLKQNVECMTENEMDFNGEGTSYKEKVSSATSVEKFEVEKNGDNGVRIVIEGQVEEESEENGGAKKVETKSEFKITFNGTRKTKDF